MVNKVITGGRTKTVYTRSDVIKLVSRDCGKSVDEVRDVLESLENVVLKTLATTNKKADVCVKLFEGITIDGVYVPGGKKKNNLTGEAIAVKSKIRPKANITRSYRDKVTNYNK